MKRKWVLSPELEGKFEVINTASPVLHSRIGDVDFRTMTVDQAEQLVKAGTHYFRAVPAKKK